MHDNQAYFLLFGAWTSYFFLHSFLASEEVKNYISSNWSINRKVQRLAYSIISILGLLLLLFLNGTIESKSLIPVTKELKIISMFLTGTGVLIVKAAFKHYSLRAFLGITKTKEHLTISGILSKVRHPIYSGTILITFGFFLFDTRMPTLVSCMAIFAYLFIGIRLEENKLIHKYGKAYLDYKKKVPMLIPKLNLF